MWIAEYLVVTYHTRSTFSPQFAGSYYCWSYSNERLLPRLDKQSINFDHELDHVARAGARAGKIFVDHFLSLFYTFSKQYTMASAATTAAATAAKKIGIIGSGVVGQSMCV